MEFKEHGLEHQTDLSLNSSLPLTQQLASFVISVNLFSFFFKNVVNSITYLRFL